MTSTDNLELTSTTNTGLPWKMVVKGSRSSTRRTKKPIARVAAAEVEAVDKSVAVTGAEGVSESEKLGVAVLGQHFAEKVEHVQLKKRRFIVCSPSPSHRSSSQHERLEHHGHIDNALHVSRLNPNLIDGRTSEVVTETPDYDGHDFSGIQILADVACSSDISTARDHLFVEEPTQQKNPSTLSVHVEVNGSSDGTVVSQKDSVHESIDQTGEDKIEIVMLQSNPVDILGHASVSEHNKVASGEMVYQRNSVAVSDESSIEKPKRKVEANESVNLASQNDTVGALEKSSADVWNEKSKDIECQKDDRLHWDLNLSMDAWGQPCGAEDDASRRDSEGDVTESVGSMEIEPVNCGKDHLDSRIASDRYSNIPSLVGSRAETATQNTKESQCDKDSQFEDGELREPYPCWEENDDAGEVEQVDYGSEPDDERFYHLGEGNECKMDDIDKGMLPETKPGPVMSESGDAPRMVEANETSDIEKHVVVRLNDSHVKGFSPSRGFSSKPFRELPSHNVVQRGRSDTYEELNEMDAESDKFVGRNRSGIHMRIRSPRRRHFSGWDSKRRLSPIYQGSSYGFGRPRPKSIVEGRGLMNDFDHPASGPDGHVRRQLSGGAYRGGFRRFADGGVNHDFRGVDRGFHGDANEYANRMHHRNSGSWRERSNSPVLKRLHYPQPYRKSRSRSRSRSLVLRNNRNRSPGFRANDRMERVRLPFQKRFPADQEMGFMSPPRNRMSPPRNSRFEERNNDYGENHSNNFRGRKWSGRMFRPGLRFDNGSPMRRVNSENHFRPIMRHRRLDGAGSNNGGGWGCKYEVGGEEEKGRNRYEMVHRPRRSDSNNNNSEGGDNIRRFRFSGE